MLLKISFEELRVPEANLGNAVIDSVDGSIIHWSLPCGAVTDEDLNRILGSCQAIALAFEQIQRRTPHIDGRRKG